MDMNTMWLRAFWKASRVLNDPAGRAIAKLDERALAKLANRARERNMSARDWLFYIDGALAALGVEGSLGGAYRDDEGSGFFALEDWGAKERLVVWDPEVGTLSLGVYADNMVRYIFATMREDRVAVIVRGAGVELVRDLLTFVGAVAGEDWREKVLKAMVEDDDDGKRGKA